MWDRLEEHSSGLESQLKSNALVKQWTNFHQEKPKPPKYQAKKLGTYLTSTERQIREAMVIQQGDYHNIMNSKSEWGTNTIPRQTVTFRDAEWDDKQGDKLKPPPTNTQPDSQQDESKRLIAPTYFEGQYAQRKKRQRLEKESAEPPPQKVPDRS